MDRIEPTYVEGVERAARRAGLVVLRHRDDIKNRIRSVHGSSAGGTTLLSPTTVQQECERDHKGYFKKNVCHSEPHGTTSSTNSTRFFSAILLFSVLGVHRSSPSALRSGTAAAG